MNIREQLEGQKNNLVQTKNQRLKSECDKPEYRPPCARNQVSDWNSTLLRKELHPFCAVNN